MPFVALDWLKDHVEIIPGTTVEQLSSDLVKVGLEEETIHPASVTGPLVAGRVLTLDAKEQSNGKVINYCRVDVGQFNDAPGAGKEPSELPSRGIICGAHNFKVGDLVVVSLPGAVLPGDFQIAQRKTYGHISDGMICSQRELGLGEDHNGIIVLDQLLPEKAAAGELPAPGESVLELLGLGEETLEINITPDRGYCFAMRGVGREYAHSTGAKFTDLGLAENLPSGAVPAISDDGFSVKIADDAGVNGKVGCDRFVTRIVTGVDTQAATPDWMVRRLEQAGMRSISLAVDATNYVMLDLGQPLHAYDLDKVCEPIVVRRAKSEEKLTTLDDVERPLDSEDLLITDSPEGAEGSRVLGLAGIMGGASTEVTDSTVNVLIEAAHFESISISRSASRHKLPTEASKRFERGVDFEIAPVAAQRVVDILVEYGGGSDSGRVSDLNNTKPFAEIVMPLHEPARLTGVEYDQETITGLLKDVGCDVRVEDGKVIAQPPSWRPDLTGPAHLVEEIARLAGYDTIPSRRPRPIAGRGYTPKQRARRDAARALAQGGLVQVLSYPFIAEDVFDSELLGEQDMRRKAVRVANPLADDQPLLRTSLLDTLLAVARRNIARGNEQCAIFETGLVTRGMGTELTGSFGVAEKPNPDQQRALVKGVPYQPEHIAGVLIGFAELPGALGSGRLYDWADAVAFVRTVAQTLAVPMGVQGKDGRQRLAKDNMMGEPGSPEAVAPFHPGRCARIVVRGACVGLAGQLHPAVCRNFGLPETACAFEIDFEKFTEAMPKKDLQVKPVSAFPPAKEDIALVVDSDIPAVDVQQVIAKQAGDLLEEVRLFDIFSGEQLGAGKKSLAFSLKIRSAEDTLSADEIQAVRNRIIKATAKKFTATLRA
ncbi:phenylalanine--tRNA ligase subunit beta [Varibaculum timonense]|uniref:phenylalanine--tRNA ligase subunit beta n=1 Tax=Varibaculum timonense TaxID=1964383 RepID=UPI0022E0C95D|nr:phenylalanine--tRNA ligase subunit beta [Varibaculum timonense]